MALIIRWFINALSLYIVSRIVTGVQLTDFGSALVAVIIIGLVNTFIKPILVLLTLPVNILTLGLFTFVINAAMIMLASSLTPGFKVDGFISALLASILLTIVSTLLFSFVS